MNADDLIALNEEIAGMARAGLPLDEGLSAMAKEMARGRLQRVTAHIAADLKAGHTLPEALQRQSGKVPPFYSGLVTAGIRTDRLEEVMATLTDYARSIADLRTTMFGALFYPAVVTVFAAVIFTLGCFYFVPQFAETFSSFNMQLPLLTTWALAIAAHPLEVMVVPLVVLLATLLLARLLLSFSDSGRRAWARFVYAVPGIGTLIRAMRLAQFTKLLAIMVDHGVPLPDAFGLAGAASNDPIMSTAARQVQEDLKQGTPLGVVLRSRLLVPELVAWMIGLGERRGALGKQLHEISAIYRRQVETRALLLRNILPPFLIIATAGVLVAFFVLALVLPMIRLLENLSK